jgi:hypothetical protein
MFKTQKVKIPSRAKQLVVSSIPLVYHGHNVGDKEL